MWSVCLTSGASTDLDASGSWSCSDDGRWEDHSACPATQPLAEQDDTAEFIWYYVRRYHPRRPPVCTTPLLLLFLPLMHRWLFAGRGAVVRREYFSTETKCEDICGKDCRRSEKSLYRFFRLVFFFLISTIKPHKALWIVQRDDETPGAASITSTINDVGNFRETNCVTKWYWPKVEFPVAWQHYLIQSHIRKRRELAMLWGRDAFPNSGTECNVRGQWSFSTILVWLSICARAILHNDMKSILNTFIVTGLRCPSERSVTVSWVVPVMPLQSREKLSCIYLPAAKVHLMSFYS